MGLRATTKKKKRKKKKKKKTEKEEEEEEEEGGEEKKKKRKKKKEKKDKNQRKGDCTIPREKSANPTDADLGKSQGPPILGACSRPTGVPRP